MRGGRRRGRAASFAVWQWLERGAAAGALVLLSPLLIALGLWVRFDSPGPALFRQTRLGHHARPFTILKFRTLRCDAGDVLQEQQNVLESGDDPRITRSGRILRAKSLDELPQLWNVVRGDMALVGPRPVMPEQRRAMPPWAERRFAVRPGVTGLAQVKGRRSLNWLEQMAWDCAFTRKDSVRLRLWIVLRTFRVLRRANDVYGCPRDNWRAYIR